MQYKSKTWHVFKPLGKSQMVSGGVGTLRFPPDEMGRRLVSLSAHHNASSGIPVLISSDVWDAHSLAEGRVINIVTARWQSMGNSGWAGRFPSISGIPKGFLVVNNPKQVQIMTRI